MMQFQSVPSDGTIPPAQTFRRYFIHVGDTIFDDAYNTDRSAVGSDKRGQNQMLQDDGNRAGWSANADVAAEAGLIYVNDGEVGITRKAVGKHFSFLSPSGVPIKDKRVRNRIRHLAIPPAWTDVWICPSTSGHIQATGRDARGRKQYLYHPEWEKTRDEVKFVKILTFARALPKLRKRLRRDMGRKRLDRKKSWQRSSPCSKSPLSAWAIANMRTRTAASV